MTQLLTFNHANVRHGEADELHDTAVRVDVWTRGAGEPLRLALHGDDARDLAAQLQPNEPTQRRGTPATGGVKERLAESLGRVFGTPRQAHDDHARDLAAQFQRSEAAQRRGPPATGSVKERLAESLGRVFGTPWQAAEEKRFGGYCVQPLGQPPTHRDGLALACFMSQALAEHIARLHNRWLEEQSTE